MIPSKAKIKVLVVDDAAFMRKAVTELLESDPELEVVGSAKDGFDGLEKIKTLHPDVVTLDIDMPRMDGLSAIRHIMIESPVPIVVLSSLAGDGAITFEALRLGVVDFVPKPSGAVSANIDRSKDRIIERIKMAASVNMENIRRVRLAKWDPHDDLHDRFGFHPLDYLIAIGTTLSGPNTVIRLISQLPIDLPAALVVVQEVAPTILPAFAKRFDEHVPWSVRPATDGELLHQGVCYISSNSHHLKIDTNAQGQACLRLEEKAKRPLNALFSSAATVFQQNAIGVLLTGIGDDGADGLSAIRKASGVALAQATNTCVYPNLIENALLHGSIDKIIDENALPEALFSIMAEAAYR
jgi:two-component system chemotaxis response regulator CheB